MPKKLPDFSNMTVDEVARFFDTESMADYEDEFDLVTESNEKLKVVSLRLKQSGIDGIKAVARQQNKEWTALIREWTEEKLQEIS